MSLLSSRALSLSVRAILLLVVVESCFACYLSSQLSITQGVAVERLIKKGWIFSHSPPSETTIAQTILSRFVPEHYLNRIAGAKPPRQFPSGYIKDSEDDLKSINKLELLVLVGGSLDAADIRVIGNLNNFGELHFEYCKFECDDIQIGDALSNLTNLRKLYLIERGKNEAVVKGILKIPCIRSVTLGNVSVDGIRQLTELPSLERMSVRTNFSDIKEAIGGRAKVVKAHTIRERSRMAGRPYQGPVLTLKRPRLSDVVVEY
jgi:hypothetical protein